ncbi:hypothetical protein [Agrobacterium pusense]|uniref:hypothetical protein n=1 Tax=Agrobacterium pusense TaxID=648995 RepID=UPI003FD006BE
MPYATYDSITTADKSDDPAWVFITEEQYLWLLDGMMNGRQVIIKPDGTPGLRTPPPWDYDGENYTYDEETDSWVPVPPPEDNPEEEPEE